MNALTMDPRSGVASGRQPVRRESLDVDDPRAQVFRPIEGGHVFVDTLLGAFDEWANQIKRKGQQHELSANCGKVLQALLRRCTDFATGICEPCLDTLMKQTRLARATVVRALAMLRRHGFLDWVRRTERIPDALPGDQQVRQVSNAYWFDLARLPRRVAAELARRMRKKGRPIEIPREPRQPLFSGRWRRRVEDRRRTRAQALAAASPMERALIIEHGDPERAKLLLELWGEGASSGNSLNPTQTTLSDKE